MFSHLTRQRNQLFLQHLAANQCEIISNLSTIQISGSTNQLDGKQLIVNLFYWLNDFKLDEITSMKSTLSNEWPMIEQLIEIKNIS